MEGLGGGEARILDHVVQLTPGTVLGHEGHTGISADTDRDTILTALPGPLDHSINDQLGVAADDITDPKLVLRQFNQGQTRAQGGVQTREAAQRARVIKEEPDNLVIHGTAVFNRIHTGLQGGFDTLRALGMGGHQNAELMGLITDGGHLILGHLRAAGLTDLGGIGHTTGCGNLDGVDTVVNVLPGPAPGLFG